MAVLIPFGLFVETGELVDVNDVPRGKRCGCICPSCETPLVARKGNVNEWNFAHLSRHVYSQTKNECDYSFFVSVRMMARQIIQQKLVLKLPAYTDVVQDDHHHESFEITPAQTITLQQVRKEEMLGQIPVDITGCIKDFVFYVYLTHPTTSGFANNPRVVPDGLKEPPNPSECGVISIALDSLEGAFADKGDTSYQEVLHDFLLNTLSEKTWVHHPRYTRRKVLAMQRLKAYEQTRIKAKKNEYRVRESQMLRRLNEKRPLHSYYNGYQARQRRPSPIYRPTPNQENLSEDKKNKMNLKQALKGIAIISRRDDVGHFLQLMKTKLLAGEYLLANEVRLLNSLFRHHRVGVALLEMGDG